MVATGMIDLHSHVLPGIDDGPASLEGSLALARAAAQSGVRTLIATPHIDHSYGLAPASVAEAVQRLAARLREEEIALEVLPGGEVALSRCPELRDEELRAVSLGGGPYILLESPLQAAAIGLESAVFDLHVRGFRVLLAHPERSPVFMRDPDTLRRLVEQGALCQITAGSLLGRFGRTVRSFSLTLLREGLVHDVASDAHDAQRRPPGLREGLAAAEGDVRGLNDQIAWLTEQAPAAILRGEPLPPRPELPQRRGLLGRLRGAS